MDKDLNELLGQFLDRPDSMEQIQSMLSSLGPGLFPPPEAPAPAPEEAPAGGPDLSLLKTLMPLLGGAVKEEKDPNVTLLRALRPYLRDGREKRVDEAIEMLQLVKLLPLLQSKM